MNTVHDTENIVDAMLLAQACVSVAEAAIRFARLLRHHGYHQAAHLVIDNVHLVAAEIASQNREHSHATKPE